MYISCYHVVLYSKTSIALQMKHHRCCESIPSAVRVAIDILQCAGLEEVSCAPNNRGAAESLLIDVGFAISEHSKEELHVVLDMKGFVLSIDERVVEMEG